ncbi:MAG: transcriptional antiterminator, Rof [Gammaproteobacteria bacterium]|nr:transcriptional antiterminator, Rof [Gammaproteobacteria bacterium]MBA3731924.1 transcriptional antiterminator, Rof [Gammaproteobacteria bacterium]
MSRNYVPVTCERYSQYELVILRGQSVRVAWHGPRGLARIEILKPLNLRTRSGGEYLIARNRLGQWRVMRLDRISNAKVL